MASVVDITFVGESQTFDFERSGKSSFAPDYTLQKKVEKHTLERQDKKNHT